MLSEAESEAAKALAHYELALFHDNNGREAEAVPHYEAALVKGLTGERRAQCLAWLASSLYKTGQPEMAMERLSEAKEATGDRDLMSFLADLERRVKLRSLIVAAREPRR